MSAVRPGKTGLQSPGRAGSLKSLAQGSAFRGQAGFRQLLRVLRELALPHDLYGVRAHTDRLFVSNCPSF